MKTKNKFISFIFTLILLFNVNVLAENSFEYEAKEIEILENGNLIKGSDEIKILINKDIVIKSDNFEYFRNSELIKIFGNVKLVDNQNNIKINNDELIYSIKLNNLSSKVETNLIYNNQYDFVFESFQYILDQKKLISNDGLSIKDELGNYFYLENLSFDIEEKRLVGKNIKFLDTEKNEYILDNYLINFDKKKILGTNVRINFDKNTFGNKKNDPRILANGISFQDKISTISKGAFTTCGKNEKCPPWSIYADEIKFDNNTDLFKYKNAKLKIYDVPVLYFPRFSHPGPNVDRKSGFLPPKFIRSNKFGTSIDVPYFHVISDNRDFTLKPKFFLNDELILQNEYRHVNKFNSHVLDFSINTPNYLSSFNDTKSHFFSSSKFDLNSKIFDNSKINLGIQKVTNDSYLDDYNIQTDIDENNVLNYKTLNSYIDYEADNENTNLDISLAVYEDLNKNKTDRYEYVYPSINLQKNLPNISENLFYNLSLEQKQYETNISEKSLINDLIYESESNILNSGIETNHNFLLRNVNLEAKNSEKYKNETDSSLMGLLQINADYPLVKINENNRQILKPKLAFMYSPNKTKNITNEDKKIDINNIFLYDRLGSDETVEGGTSATYGGSYSISDQSNKDIFEIELASILRFNENEDLPIKNNFGRKSTDLFGNIKYIPNDALKFGYNFIVDNNYQKTSYDSFSTTFSINNFVNTFEYLNNKSNKKYQNYISNNSSIKFSEKNAVDFTIRKNKQNNATEFYDLIYKYSNDCLIASVKYNKKFYKDTSSNSEKNIILSLAIVPFGATDK